MRTLKESVNSRVNKNFLEVLQIFGVQSLCMGKFIIATEHVIFIFAELVERQKLNFFRADLFKSLNETFCVVEGVVIIWYKGQTRQNFLPMSIAYFMFCKICVFDTKVFSLCLDSSPCLMSKRSKSRYSMTRRKMASEAKLVISIAV